MGKTERVRAETPGDEIAAIDPAVPIAPPGPPADPAVEEVYVFRASHAQRRLWLLDRLTPGNPFYNIPFALRLEGRLDVAALAASLRRVVERHESLRTTFGVVDGEPVQLISPRQPIALPVVDLTALGERRRGGVAAGLGRAEAVRPFDLARGPLARAALLRLADDENVVLFTLHHIVGDLWSLGVLVGEVGRLYAAALAGAPDPLPEPPIQYADYSEWQHGWLDGEELDRQLAYWLRRLGDGVPVLDLPTDRPRPRVQTFRGSSRSRRADGGLTRAARALARAEGTTLFTLCLTVFEALLHRYTGAVDFAVGTPVSGRGRVETEGLIGFFVNTLVMRAELAGELALRAHLARVHAAVLEAHGHQDLPFEMLVEELAPQRSLGQTPLFQVMVTLQNAPVSALVLPGLRVAEVEVERGTAKVDLALFVTEERDGLECELEYGSDLFDGVTVERMLGHFLGLLEAATLRPEAQLGDLALLSASERHQLAVEWNDRAAELPPASGLVEVFARRAAERGQAEAVVWGEARLTYAELAARAAALAAELAAAGVERGQPVGICAERSELLPVGILGILGAGGAYVPLDPEYPRERLAAMLADSGARAVVVQPHLEAALPAGAATLVPLDAGSRGGPPALAPPAGADPDDLAYNVYTSA
jgi:hypothetical protein